MHHHASWNEISDRVPYSNEQYLSSLVLQNANTIEISTYGPEIVDTRIASELCIEIGYKLRMLGVNIDNYHVWG